MLRKNLISLLIAAVLLMGSAAAAFAAEIHTFGYTDERQRLVTEPTYPPMEPAWWVEVGKSYSQPLVLDGSKFGKDKPVVVMMAGNYLWGIQDGPRDYSENKNVLFQEEIPGGWGEPSASHTTYYKTKDGRELLFSGTKDGFLVVHDLKGNEIHAVELGTRIVSTPLVTEWNGHLLAVAGSDDGNAYIVTNYESEPTKFWYHVGGILTSSPAPMDDEGFIIGSDGAGKVVAFKYDDVLQETADGKLEKKPGADRAWFIDRSVTPIDGVPASFAVFNDKIFFSDVSGRLFMADKYTGAVQWVNDDLAGGGTFINHSPAVGSSTVIFPVGNVRGSGKGALAVLDKGTGRLLYRLDATSRVVTAPVIWKSAGLIAAGEENGTLDLWRTYDWQLNQQIPVFNPPDHQGPASTAEGISAEISIANGLLLVAGSDAGSSRGGYLIAWGLQDKPLDLAVTSLESSVPPGQKAEPGQTYRAKFTVKNLSGKDVKGASVKFTVDGVLQDLGAGAVVDLAAGEEKAYDVSWQAPNDKSSARLSVTVNQPPDPAIPEVDYGNNKKSVLVPVNYQNLRVDEISFDPGTVQPGERVRAYVNVYNDADVPVNGTGFVWKVWRQNRNLFDENNITIDVPAGGSVPIEFSFIPDTDGTYRVACMVNPDHNNPPNEINFLSGDWPGDNRMEVPYQVDDPAREAEPGDSRLHLQAYSWAGTDIYGEYHESRPREIDEKTQLPTAKWCDDVTATLTVTKPTPPRGWLDWWEISWAKITYPEQHPDFCFGNPVPSVGGITKAMSTPGRADPGIETLEATSTFVEDWAKDGFGTYNMMTGEIMAEYPRNYDVSVQFCVTYQYSYIVCGGDPPSCWVVTEVRSYTDTAAAKLRVTGAAMIPY